MHGSWFWQSLDLIVKKHLENRLAQQTLARQFGMLDLTLKSILQLATCHVSITAGENVQSNYNEKESK